MSVFDPRGWDDAPPDQPPDWDPQSVQRPWLPVDLTLVLEGTWKPPQPAVGRRSDGVGLFYPGKQHTVASETEGGKTWLALSAVLDELNTEHHVVYLDFEDDEGGIVGRLLTMGAHRDRIREQFHYLRPTERLGTGINLDDLVRVLERHEPTLGVLDGITEAMTMHGLSPLDNADTATFGRMLPRRIAEAGAAVASLDHVTKDRENRGRYALGAAHKLNGLDGAAYTLTSRTSFGVGLRGKSTVYVAKDRIGQLRRQALPAAAGLYWFGDLVLDSKSEQYTEVSVEPPHERDENFRPTVLMERVALALQKHGELSQRRICAAVTGRAENVRQALDCLILDGYVCEATPHKLLKPYTPKAETT